MSSETRYARTEDGVHLAYQLLGEGPIDVLMMAPGFVPVDAMLEEPNLARFLYALAEFSRVIRFDFRGLGLSDPVAPSDPPTLEQWVQDSVAVLDAVGSERAAVFAAAEIGKIAVLLTASRPDRVSSMVLVNAFANAVAQPDFVIDFHAGADLDEVVEAFVDPEGQGPGDDYLDLANPSMRGNPEFRDWWTRAGNRGASPAMARAVLKMTLGADVRDVLPAVNVPTLIAYRRDNEVLPAEHALELAERIPGAKWVEVPGRDDLYWIGDPEALLGELREFLTGARGAPDMSRVLLSVLFTDVVGSTERATALGDARWRRLLEEHDRLVLRELRRWGGQQVKTMGDGTLATFDAPVRAVRCACAIRDAIADIGLTMRAGVHTGEVELRGADIAGIAVHIGQRVSNLAEAGEVVVTRTVVDLVAGSDLTFEDRGTHSLKGVPEPRQIFALTSE